MEFSLSEERLRELFPDASIGYSVSSHTPYLIFPEYLESIEALRITEEKRRDKERLRRNKNQERMIAAMIIFILVFSVAFGYAMNYIAPELMPF
jgi:hypothetical protein